VRLRFVLVPVAALAIAALVAGEGRSPDAGARGDEPVLAVTDGRLARLDPRSLEPLAGGRVRLHEPVNGWARSGSRLAVLTGSTLRFFDIARMRAAGELAIGARGSVALMAWPRRDRLWVVLAAPGCCATGTTTVVTVDPARRRVVARRELAAGLARAAAAGDRVVLLLSPTTTIGPARLATVDAGGKLDLLPLDGVSAGLQPTEGVPFLLRARQPGLAVDPRRNVAYVMPSRPQVLEVDLRRLRIGYHGLTPHRSLLDRVRDLLEPPAEAQQAIGPVRSARWLTSGSIALAGRDSHASWRPGGAVEYVTRPAGVQLIDTRRWEVRTLDEQATSFVGAGGAILTGGPRAAVHRRGEATRVLEGRSVELLGSAGSLAYVREGRRLHVVDLEAGRVVGTSGAEPLLLLDSRPGPWE